MVFYKLKKISQIKEIKLPKLYKHFLSLFFAFNAGILNSPGNKFIAKG